MLEKKRNGTVLKQFQLIEMVKNRRAAVHAIIDSIKRIFFCVAIRYSFRGTIRSFSSRKGFIIKASCSRSFGKTRRRFQTCWIGMAREARRSYPASTQKVSLFCQRRGCKLSCISIFHSYFLFNFPYIPPIFQT